MHCFETDVLGLVRFLYSVVFGVRGCRGRRDGRHQRHQRRALSVGDDRLKHPLFCRERRGFAPKPTESRKTGISNFINSKICFQKYEIDLILINCRITPSVDFTIDQLEVFHPGRMLLINFFNNIHLSRTIS